MASLYHLLENVYDIHKLYFAQKSAEKAKVNILKQESRKAFQQVYDQCLSTQSVLNTSLTSESNHTEFQVALAEAAYFTEQFEIARQILELYFQSDVQKDQFYCRGKTLLGLLINYEARNLSGTGSLKQRKKAVGEIMQALEIASSTLNSSRYKFLVYNISISFWEVVRPFLRNERAGNFASEFYTIVAALEKLDDNDLDWRILFLSAAAIAADDEKNSKNATDFVEKAIVLLEQLINALNVEEQKLQKVLNECKTEVDVAMNAFREIQEREELLKKPRKIDPDLPPDDEYYTKPIEYPPLQGLAAEGFEKVKEMLDEAQYRRGDVDIKMKDILALKTYRNEQLIKLHCERIALNPSDAKRYSSLPNIQSNFRLNTLAQIQLMLSNVIPDKECDSTLSSLLTKLHDMPEGEKRNETLLDLCRAAWRLNQFSAARKIMDACRNGIKSALSQNLRIKMDVCEAFSKLDSIEEVVKSAAQNQNLTRPQIEGLRLSQRIDVIKIMDRALTMALTGIDDKYFVLEVCSYMWNIMIPLLTKRTRLKIHSSLRSVATALETISIDYVPTLRALVHHELAKCEDDADYAGLALIEEKKAFSFDFGGISKPSEINPNLLDFSRPNDQFIIPYVKSLNLRVDVYGSPPDICSQAILWLQQAKESTSKVFIKEMIYKTSILLFEEIEMVGLAKDTFNEDLSDTESTNVDWSLAVMQKGQFTFPPTDLGELQSALTSVEIAENEFSYSLQLRFQLLVMLVRLAHSIQEVNILQKAALLIFRTKWNIDSVYSAEFIDFQIEVACLLAESFSVRITSEKKNLMPTRNLNNIDLLNYFSLGIEIPEINEDLLKMKKLVIASMEKAFRLSIMRKDIYAVQNVLTYFWNLHLHLFKDYSQFSTCIKEVFEFIKFTISSIDSILSFPGISTSFEPKIFLNFMNVYSIYAEVNLLQPQEAVEVAVKGAISINYPSFASGSLEACYLKHQLFERASVLTVLNSINGVSSGGKGSKGSAASEPLASSDNPMLNVYSNLAVAELYSNEKVPREVVLAALEKAVKLILNDMIDQVQKEETAEQKGTMIRLKELSEQRLEMRLECYARISRLKIIYNDYVAAQDIADLGVKLFNKIYPRNTAHISTEDLGENLFEESGVSEVESGKSRIFRWMACCEKYLALSVISFFECNGKSGNGTAALEPSLGSRLQFIALQHLQPCLNYAIQANSMEIIQSALELALTIAKDLILNSDYTSKVFLIGNLIIDDSIRYLSQKKIRYNPDLYVLLKDLFLVLIKDLVTKESYDLALKLLYKAFEIISDSTLQKDLWPSRVICMSKKGMSVLDGLQKLKERDPLLQAAVLALFARSTKDINQKISTYQQVLEILEGRPERVDYLIELCEVMNAYGFPRSELKFMLREASAIYSEIEEGGYDEIKEWEEGDDEELKPENSFENMTNKKGKSSIAKSRKGPSVSGENTKANSRAGGSQQPSAKANSVNGRSRAPSRSGISATEIPATNAKQLTMNFKFLEQSARLCVMLAKIELKDVEKTKLILKGVFYVYTAFNHCVSALQEIYKKNSYSSLPVEQRSDISLELYSPETPEYLKFPTDLNYFLQFTSNSQLLQMIKDNCQSIPLDLPSLESLPAFNATIFNLFELVNFLFEKQLYDFINLVVAFIKVLLLTMPESSTENDSNNRTSALVCLQLLSYKLFYLEGRQIDLISTATSNFLYDSNFVPLSPGAVITSYIQTVRLFYAQRGQIAKQLFELSVNDLTPTTTSNTENLNPFQLPLSNLEFNSLLSLDSLFYWIKAVPLLLSLGQFSVAEQLILVLLFQARECKKSKMFSEIIIYYNELAYINGKNLELISFTLSHRELLQNFGDSSLFLKHFRNLLNANSSLHNYDETKSIVQLMIQLISDVCVKKIVKSRTTANDMSKSTVFPGASTKALISKTSITTEQTLKPSTVPGTTSSKGDYSVLEIGSEYFEALKIAIVHHLVFLKSYYNAKLMTFANPSIPATTTEKLDLNEIFVDIFERYLDLNELFMEHLGENNDFVKEILYTRGMIGFELIKCIHQHYSKFVNVDLTNYTNWIAEKLFLCARFIKEATEMQKLQCERYQQLDIFKNTLVDGNIATKSDSFQDGITLQIDFSPSNVSGKLKSSYLVLLGKMQLNYANILFYISILEKDYAHQNNFESNREQDVITRYLQETEPEENLVHSSKAPFIINRLTQIISYANSALGNLEGNDKELQAKFLLLTSSMALNICSGEFDIAWNSSSTRLPSVSALHYRESLQTLIKQNLDSNDENIFDCLCIGCFLVIESYGVYDTTKSSSWLFILQSLQSKFFLRDMWRKTLTQQNEILSSVRRLEFFQNCNYPNPGQFKCYQTDRAFLKASVPALKRLSVVAEPSDIMNSIESFYSQTIFCCLQLCPQRKFAYICVGRKPSGGVEKPKDGKSSGSETKDDGKSYLVDKMELTEENRRLLQTVLEQQKIWQLDVSKFMALNGDNYFDNDDLDDPTDAAADKSVHQKSERALDERFKALVVDLETVFAPLVGKGSATYKFISEFLIAKGSSSNQWNITLLLDTSLQNLPWEALPFVDDFFHLKSCRDYSLQMISHRIQTLIPPGSQPNNTVSLVNSSTIKYVVDPLQEDSGSKLNGKERKSVTEIWKMICQKLGGGSKWSKLRSQNGLLSLEDFLLCLDNSGSKSPNSYVNLFACCLGRFGSILSPKDISIMNLEKIQFLCCVDNSYNDVSYRRQNSYDVLKNVRDIELENGLQMSALLSLAGVNSLLINFWSIPLVSQNRFMNNFWKAFTSKEKLFSAVSSSDRAISALDQVQPSTPSNNRKQKAWISFSRILYGIPSFSYSD